MPICFTVLYRKQTKEHLSHSKWLKLRHLWRIMFDLIYRRKLFLGSYARQVIRAACRWSGTRKELSTKMKQVNNSSHVRLVKNNVCKGLVKSEC